MRLFTFVLAASLTAPLLAAPSISLVDNGGGSATLNITTDAPGALGAEIALEFTAGLSLLDATVNETLFDTPNPGDNPFIAGSPAGGDTTGLWIDAGQNALFASFGSDDLGVGTFEFLSFNYAGSGVVTAQGVVAQEGVNHPVFYDNGVYCFECDFGDFDGSGAWNDGDLTLLLSNWGQSVPPVPAGWTGVQPTAPGIGDDELTKLLNNWGATAGAAVPEPGAMALLLMVSATGLLRRSL